MSSSHGTLGPRIPTINMLFPVRANTGNRNDGTGNTMIVERKKDSKMLIGYSSLMFLNHFNRQLFRVAGLYFWRGRPGGICLQNGLSLVLLCIDQLQPG